MTYNSIELDSFTKINNLPVLMVYPPPVEIVLPSDFNQETVKAEVRSDMLHVKVVVDPGPTSLVAISISEIEERIIAQVQRKLLKRLSSLTSLSGKHLKRHVRMASVSLVWVVGEILQLNHHSSYHKHSS